MNVEWHTQNRLCRSASLEQRVQWHLAHVEACDCRGLPASIEAELRRRDEERRTAHAGAAAAS
jgi:hypothetical protein